MTTSTRQMIETHPISAARAGLIEAMQAASDCAQVCSICADACLSEPMVANLTQPRLRHDLRSDGDDPQPPERWRIERDGWSGEGLHGGVPGVRRRVRAPRDDDGALSRLRRRVPSLRAGLPRLPGQHLATSDATPAPQSRRQSPPAPPGTI